MHFLIGNKLNSFNQLNEQPMQSLVKYSISLLFALLINLIPGRLALDHSGESVAPRLFDLPASLCVEDFSLPQEEQHPRKPAEADSLFAGLKASCS